MSEELTGTWEADHDEGTVWSDTGRVLDSLPLPGDDPEGAKERARLNLIAAAPEMAEALEAMVDEACDYMQINKLGDPEKQHNIRRARAALAKARGEG